MAKAIYLGVDGKARKMKKSYIGIEGKARKIKKVYVGVDSKARLAYTDYVAVTSIEISGSYKGDTINGNSATFHVNFNPADATDKTVTWSVTGDTKSTSNSYDKNYKCWWSENDDGSLTLYASGKVDNYISGIARPKTVYITATTSNGVSTSRDITIRPVSFWSASSSTVYVWNIY